MNRRTPYEEALSGKVDEIPLPDEDASWQHMNSLLDKDDKPSAPFWWMRDYRVLGVLTILLIGWGLWLMNADLNMTRKPGTASKPASNKQTLYTPALPSETTINPGVGDRLTAGRGSESLQKAGDATPSSGQEETDLYRSLRGEQKVDGGNKTEANEITLRDNRKGFLPPDSRLTVNKTDNQIHRSDPGNLHRNPKKHTAGIIAHRKQDFPANGIDLHDQKGSSEITKSAGKEKPAAPAKEADTVKSKSILNDTAGIASTAPAINKTAAVNPGKDNEPTETIKIPSPRKYLISAGLGVQQQIQTGGQQSIKYGYNAGSRVSDYIPSGWINFGVKNKWFLQTGFVFSSPQYVREFAFNRQTTADTFGSVTNTLRLKKTFYSQVPLSFNYHLKQNWTIGAGATFTWLRGAIAEKETSIKQTSSPTPLVSREIIPIKGFTDSFLYRSSSFLTLQTDYHWKRISLGLRYSKDLQSYIKYTMPDGGVAENRNWGLQVIGRIRLWQREFR